MPMTVPVVIQMPMAVAVEAVIGTTATRSAASYRVFAAQDHFARSLAKSHRRAVWRRS